MKTTILKLSVLSLLTISLFSCKKEEPINPSTNNAGGTSITSTRYVSFTLNGSTKTFENGLAGTTNSVEEMGSGTVSNYVMVNGGTFLNTSAQEKISIHLIKGFTSVPTAQQKENMFSVGIFGYGKEYSNPLVEGGLVWYIDANGTEWRTDNGTANQTGSSFEIKSITTTNGADAYSGKKIMEVEFNCKLYDGSGNSKTLTNGLIKTVVVDANS